VIARPFLGAPGAFYRTENRHDYAVPPPRENLLPLLQSNGFDVRVYREDRLNLRFSRSDQDLPQRTMNSPIDQTIRALRDNTPRPDLFEPGSTLTCFYGHRRDTEGYARALEHFDSRWPEIEAAMNEDDLVIITADHGNDLTYPGTDPHGSKYAPLVAFGKARGPAVNWDAQFVMQTSGRRSHRTSRFVWARARAFLRKII